MSYPHELPNDYGQLELLLKLAACLMQKFVLQTRLSSIHYSVMITPNIGRLFKSKQFIQIDSNRSEM